MKDRLTKQMKFRDHGIYEIWNEYAAESVYFCSDKPTIEELVEICKREWWPMVKGDGYISTPEEYVEKWIHVEHLQHVYGPAF